MTRYMDPDTALIYLLLKRGSVLESTFEQLIAQIHDEKFGSEAVDEKVAAVAERLLVRLWTKVWD